MTGARAFGRARPRFRWTGLGPEAEIVGCRLRAGAVLMKRKGYGAKKRARHILRGYLLKRDTHKGE